MIALLVAVAILGAWPNPRRIAKRANAKTRRRITRAARYPDGLLFVELVSVLSHASLLPREAVQSAAQVAPHPDGLEVALREVAVGEPLAAALSRALPDHGLWPQLAEMVSRTERTGASLSAQLDALVDYSARRLDAQALTKIRRVGVQATLPLGLCFLPAFVLVGIVPVGATLWPN